MLRANEPGDFVIATGVRVTVKTFLAASLEPLNLDWTQFEELDEVYLRPTEVDALVGNPSKIRRLTSWEPETSAMQLAAAMTSADLRLCGSVALWLCEDASFADAFEWRY